MRSRLERVCRHVADSMAASQSASALRFHVFTERFHTFVHLQRDSCTSGSGQLNLVKPDHKTGETTRARPDGGPRSIYLQPVIKSGKHAESVRLIWFAALLPGWGQNRLMRHYWLIVESQRPHAHTHTHTEAVVEIKPECCGKMWCSRVSAARLKERLCGSEYYSTHEPQQPLLSVHTGKTSVVWNSLRHQHS